MNRKYQWLAWMIATSLSCGGVVGCRQLNQVGIGTKPIEQVVRNASSDNLEATVRGEVVSQVKILKQGAYLLKDSSGFLWVFTEKALPSVKSTVTVRGKTQKGLVFASINADVVLTEEERL